ncbi:proline-rich receptor-like protein kinase PERK8 [Lactuca sativa]|uniref:proline-rich receptor-like protein kinase PERK8 n=1 Tax=Lactuca sativa TaxID=4236 RepID=UPI0022AF21AA|nr:proline-rich receptor-like protein kinase PERK8 [Lactuca sativa]
MAKRPKEPMSSSSNEEEQSVVKEEEVQHEVPPRGNTPPRSPTPEVQVHVPTPPPSPKQTTIPISSAPIPPPVTSQPTTVPLPPPIFSSATTTTTTGPSMSVNISYTGEHTVGIDTPVTTKPLSPSPLTNSKPILGGEHFDFDSTYYSGYRIPSEDDDDASVTKLHLKDIHGKLDNLLGS